MGTLTAATPWFSSVVERLCPILFKAKAASAEGFGHPPSGVIFSQTWR
jgi:hypothetical protein